jgi:DNA (cytosine-5)-methyltransferase 1
MHNTTDQSQRGFFPDKDAIEIQKKFIAIDLFSGAGGLTLGLKQAGFHVIGAIDCDDLAVETYLLNHPEVAVWNCDIRDLEITKVKSALGIRRRQLDLLAGCPPCQNFSSLKTLRGKRSIENDSDSDLVFEFMRFVRELLPRVVMMENVPELAQDRRIQVVLEELSTLGYTADPHVVHLCNAADYGVPQRRHRMLLLASRLGNVQCASPDGQHIPISCIIRGLPLAGQSGDPLHDFPEVRSEQVMKRISNTPKNGGSRIDLGESYQLECHKKNNGFKDVYGRMAWDKIAPTITGGCTNPSKGRFIHPEYDRAITLREAALLQGFPPDYQFALRRGKGPASQLIGNALPPEFVKRHAEEVYRHLIKSRRIRPS